MRGKALFVHECNISDGITPAYAGKSPCNRTVALPSRDHPCVCGEKGAIEQDADTVIGSPLRMRGKAVVHELGYGADRITPAYAGKS